MGPQKTSAIFMKIRSKLSDELEPLLEFNFDSKLTHYEIHDG